MLVILSNTLMQVKSNLFPKSKKFKVFILLIPIRFTEFKSLSLPFYCPIPHFIVPTTIVPRSNTDTYTSTALIKQEPFRC